MADWIHNQNQAPKPTNPSKTQMSEPHKKKKKNQKKNRSMGGGIGGSYTAW
jgi:hypothetical protein